MTTQAIPDPAGLKSWEEAFQYPLPTVQKLSVRLRKDIDDHRNRLRSLVGASYRDLLGTAERIIDMDVQIQTVESSLSDIGRRCNSRMIERGDANYTGLERSWGRRDGEEDQLGSAARIRVLSAASSMVERLVKREGNALQAAKLMVLSRLLYKSLEDEDDQHAKVERHRRKISSLRNRLLAHVDRILSKPSLPADEVTYTLSAFALLSSSKLRDVLGHFLAVRTAQLKTLSAAPTSSITLDVLTLYIDTIQLVQSIFPKRIAESLSNLGKITLLSDKDITQVTELNLDIYGRWIADDIWSFRPWVQQDGFPGKEAREDLSKFSTSARSILLATLQQCLRNTDDATEVLTVRQQVLGAYLSLGSEAKLDGLLEHVEEVRTAFTEHLGLLARQTATIDDFTLDHSNSTDDQSQFSRSSIWNLADRDLDLSSGGINLRKSVLRLRQGHDSQFDQVVAPLQRWYERIRTFSITLDKMRTVRWDERFDVDFEDGEEEIGKVFQSRFAVDDPARIEQCLREHVAQSLTQTTTAFEQATSASNDTHRPDFLLRVLREFHRYQQLIRASVRLSTPSAAAQHNIIRTLHSSLAQLVSQRSLQAFEESLSTKQYIASDLWDGTPSLPLQPLPTVFKFVMALQRDMSSYNEDIWSFAAVHALKSDVGSKIAQALLLEPPQNLANEHAGIGGAGDATNDSIEAETDKMSADRPEQPPETADKSAQPEGESSGPDDTATEVEAESKQTPEVTADKPSTDNMAEIESLRQATLHNQQIQRLLDAMYLRSIFASNGETDTFKHSITELKSRAELEKNDLQRLEKNATEYWRRTYLLLGLLAPPSTSVATKR